MKKTTLLFYLLFLSSIASFAQAGNNSNNTSNTSGNQIQRDLICVTCPLPAGTEIIPVALITKESMVKSEVSDHLFYYHYPVQQELHFKWEFENENIVSAIKVYSMSGQLLNSYPADNITNSSTIGFQNYPRGIYNLIFLYDNEEQKALKIVKQ